MEASEDFFSRKNKETGVSLNQVQKQAVLQTEGALLLLASPGSGKTTTIIMRIGYLIEERRVAPSRIKAVTFSRASAADMKERFTRFFPDLPPVDFSTIHSFAFEVVREHFRKTGTAYQIIEGDIDLGEQVDFDSDNPPLHKKLIIRHLFKTMAGDNITDDQMDELTTYISYIKNKMIPMEEWSLVKCDVKNAEQILREYEAFKRSGSDKLLIDYDDMLTIGNEVLERDTILLRKVQQRYDYVLTDESQDTSLVQHAIIEKLVRKHGNLCVVADDDQSIYSWRGAEPSYLLNFKQSYPRAVTLFMEQNYRSSKDIVHAANQFIKRNKSRYDKNMFTRNPPHKPIKIRSLADYQYQAKHLVQEIQKVENLRDLAVLYRNNSSSITLMNEFDRAGIPFYMKDADIRFFSHWVVKDILNFMRMTFTDKRVDIMEEIHTKINGYITKQQMAALKEIHNNESVFDNLLNYVQLKDYQRKQLQECKETLQQMKGIPPLDAIRGIRRKLGYEKAIEKLSERLGFSKEYLIGILNTLEEIANSLETMEEFAKRLKYLESVMKTSKFNKNHNVVTFSTLHSAKGLEFERVYMIDLIDGIIPSNEDMDKNRNGNPSFMEEAVRLFYVGMTRAKIDLELITYKERDGEKVKESPFISNVRSIVDPPKPTHSEKKASVKPHNPRAIRHKDELRLGSIVGHRVFGLGEIIKIDEDRIHVRFSVGDKILSIQICLETEVLEPAD
ncbi:MULTISPECIES: ATP-dependent helicase [unclassified Paenibacillus]|uniref:ATP-dependent helicase n=1 Tax=unclassified Paenibacillus TaxID=185978 RepID=UPI001AE12A31|nr:MULTISPECIES: ATP-dependent helicase [unclassified Paenibacillus]MBP1157024.1 DNA helicase-2/ATP-dependent DNA helicase PcrA [Paenibacillus sp. PvP091]MBP1172237.1 DNA helicase-2/ATP-dependent DNA helicase PcrA [Paenibacillus sp. PvR098]MBP2438618.1 DNA helicase-2/ATP-dependent DNA helicase PcrA [Paenibacillus sp. PvP052]